MPPATFKADAKATDKGGGAIRGLSESMVADLTSHRTAALRLEVARSPSVALAACVHGMVLSAFFPTQSASCLELSVRSAALVVHDRDEGSAHALLDDLVEQWRSRLPADPDDLWGWCLDQDQQTLLELLALAGGLSVNAIAHQERPHGGRVVHTSKLAAALGFDVAAHWHPKASSFFSRLTKAQMGAYLRSSGYPALADDVLKLGKSAAAERTAKQLTEIGWLPVALRDEPVTPSTAKHADGE